MTKPLTLKPPSTALYAAVQVETADGKILGAAPAFHLDGQRMVPAPQVTVDCHPGHAAIVHWVHEDSSQGLDTVSIGGHGRWA